MKRSLTPRVVMLGERWKREARRLARCFIHLSIALSLTLALAPENNAFATPIAIHIDGYLRDATDAPVTITATFQFKLFDVAVGGSVVYDTGLVVLGVLDGNFSYDLGSSVSLDDSLFSSTRWLDTVVSQEVLSPRVAITDAHDTPDGISSNAIYEVSFGSAIPPTVDPAPVPEPSTWMLLGTGLVCLVLYRWRRKKQTA